MISTFQFLTSASFRCQPIWDVLSPILESSDVNLTVGGSRDDTYDIAIYESVLDPMLDAVLHVLVFTPSAIEEAAEQATLSRIKQFVLVHNHASRYHYVAVVFLRSETTFQKASRCCTIDALVAFQALLFDSPSIMDIPIMMLAEPDELLPSLKQQYHAIQRIINQPADINPVSLSSQAPSNSPQYLLEQIVIQGSDPLSYQQNVNVLGDFFPSLRALSAGSRTAEMRQLVSEYLGEQFAKHVESFWNKERAYV